MKFLNGKNEIFLKIRDGDYIRMSFTTIEKVVVHIDTRKMEEMV